MSNLNMKWLGHVSGVFVAAMLLLTASLPAAAETILTGAGATFPYPLYSKWFSVYEKATGVRINYQSIGSGGGIQQLKAGTVDFGASDAPLSDAEMRQMPSAVVHIPTVAGAVAIVYNVPQVGKGLRLSADAITGIYLGQITRWDDPKITALNPKLRLANLPVAVVHRSDGSGTSYIFTNYLAAVSRTWATRVGAGKSVDWPMGIGGKGNEGVAGLVKQTPGGIGYVELAYAMQNKLAYASIRNRDGAFVAPSIASTVAAASGARRAMARDVRVSIVNAPGKGAYPIAGFTYLLVYQKLRNPAAGGALVKFLTWAIHDGQKYAEPLLYAPLPEALVNVNESKIKAITHDAALPRSGAAHRAAVGG
jgi:phosphate transport system substrate-binding protein